MKPETFVFVVSLILLFQILFYFCNDINIYKLNIIDLYVITYVFMIIIFQYALLSGKKVLLEIPHLWMNLTVIITTFLVNDMRILKINALLLLLTVLSRLYYNGCAINLAGYKEKKIIPDLLLRIQREITKKTNITWTHIYGILLIINVYKMYVR
jgi:hypothetical protein